MFAYLKNIAYYLPDRVDVNGNDRLAKKTGIRQRHIASDHETAGDMAVQAAQKLFDSGVDKNQVEYVLLCTQTPDYLLPTTACIIQDRLKLSTACGALDFNLGCSGYIYGLSLAKGLIESGQVKNVLLLTAETYSKHIPPLDTVVKPLFGDGATATFIEVANSFRSGMEGFVFGTDGSGYDQLIVNGRGARDNYNNHQGARLHMDGSRISEFALAVVPPTIDRILDKCNLHKADIDYYVFHQANKFMLDFLQTKCGLEGQNYWNDVRDYGNTVSSSIPIAIRELVARGIQQSLSNVMLIGFGVGLSWGGCIVDLGFLNKANLS